MQEKKNTHNKKHKFALLVLTVKCKISINQKKLLQYKA
jgi:hypothetical protein